MKNVVMYTQDLCGYCTAAAKEFEKNLELEKKELLK